MCGIAGILYTDGRHVQPRQIEALAAALAHRGPDGSGVHVAGCLGLGHRRLAIIDLDGGAQPLANEDGTIWVTFNGEIYNYRELRSQLERAGHRFRTASDTETLVHGYEEWGTGLPSRLRGMFAFAIWDGRQRRLFLARDRVGIKPLYYLEQPGLFAFASEMQAFRQLEDFAPTVDPQAIDMYLQYQYIPAPYTIFREVRKLAPAHSLEVDGRGDTRGPTRYWDLEFRPDRTLSEDQWVERIDAALEETVRTHLVSDVPVGAFLSGGVDSSTVLAYMNRIQGGGVKAFCIGHNDDDYDERQFAREAAQACGADYFEEVVEPDALALLPELVQHYGEPFGDSSAIPTYYVSQLARRHVKLVLSGDGGDELFAGYHAYQAILWEHRAPDPGWPHLRHWLANGARGCGLWPGIKTIADSKYERVGVIDAALRARLWRPELAGLLDGTRADFDAAFARGPRNDTLNRLQYFDIFNYIAFDNLTKVDVASMYHGLEVRVPLLDHVFLETAAQVPPELKLRAADGVTPARGSALPPGNRLVGKYLLKKNAERFFSRDFIHRGKRGFEVPIREWFAGPFQGELRDRLLDSGSPLTEYFEPDCLVELVDAAAASRAHAWKGWLLLVLQEWFTQFSSVPARCV